MDLATGVNKYKALPSRIGLPEDLKSYRLLVDWRDLPFIKDSANMIETYDTFRETGLRSCPPDVFASGQPPVYFASLSTLFEREYEYYRASV